METSRILDADVTDFGCGRDGTTAILYPA